MNEIKPVFSEEFDQAIWRIYTDFFEPTIVIETRSNQNFEARFSALSLPNYQWLMKDKVFPENWWIGVSAVAQGIIFFYLYKDTQKPEPQGIIAYHARQNKVLWEHYHLLFDNLTPQFLLAYQVKESTKKYYTINYHTGELQEFNPLANLLPLKCVNTHVHFPSNYNKNTKFFEIFVDFLKKRFNLHKISTIDYIEYTNLIILSYIYEQKNYLLDNQIIILNSNNKVLWQDTLQTDFQHIATDTFFLFEQRLIYIKNKRELIIVLLPNKI